MPTRMMLRDWWGDGLSNVVAQTRIATSYSLLQMLYRTATERRYPKDSSHRPEDLNVTETIFELSMKHQKRLLQERLGSSLETLNNWALGFENTFEKAVYGKWNSDSKYPGRVFTNLQHFLPQE